MDDSRFVPLRVHSHFSFLRSTAAVEDLVARAASDGVEALALTDSAGLYGAVGFDWTCREAGIRPIIGATVPVRAPAGRMGQGAGALVLLARNRAGYRSLCGVVAALQAAPDREERLARGVAWRTLAEHADGLIAIDGGRDGWLRRLLAAGQPDLATRYLALLGGAYGEHGFIGVTVDRPGDVQLGRTAAELGARFGLETVALHPVYGLTASDTARLPLLAAIERNCLLEDLPRQVLPGDGAPDVVTHWLSPAEISERYAEFPDALARTAAVAARCGEALPDGTPLWPAPPLPDGLDAPTALAQQARAGLDRRYLDPSPAARERLDRELAAIRRHGFDPLFLIVADVVRHAREREIPVSTRGSVANSLVAYCLGITTVDPLAHDLLFERFLNPARAQPPDIDLDFCSRRRDEVLEYVRDTYGADRVAMVGTMNSMRLRSALRAVGKALGVDEKEVGTLARRLPRSWHPDPRRRGKQTLAEMLEKVEEPHLKEVVTRAYALRGQPDHLSVHPGGVVITPGPLTDVVPIQWAPKGFVITQYDHHDVEAIGLPKLDLLGIRALTVLADVAELVRTHHDPDFRLEEIPLDDPATGDALSRGEAIGVFQCESSGAQRTLRQLQARTVEDLAVANAFFKPGPATGGMAQAFIRRYRGEEETAFLHPSLEPIVGRTRGVLLFQEQILRVAREIAGLSWEQADHLRRGMSKFQAEEMAALQEAFERGCRREPPAGPGLTPQQARTLWEQVLAFAGYGFNQGHATAYADVSYRSAYVRTHWPAAFLAARLAVAGGFHHPVIYMAEARRLGIGVRPPHVNHSRGRFTVSYDGQGRATLWMGLGQVRDLRRAAQRAIMAERPFESLRDLLGRVEVRTKEIRHLIQVGALDGLGDSRAALLAEAGEIGRAGSPRQMSLFGEIAPAVAAENGAQRLKWEQRLLGWPVSVHPLELVGGQPAGPRLADLPETRGGRVSVPAVRLPGWTGGQGIFIDDGNCFVIARVPKGRRAPGVWEPAVWTGRWRLDRWGGGWLEVERVQVL